MMTGHVWQVRLWPWAADSRNEEEVRIVSDDAELSFPFYGNPLLEVPQGVEFLLPRRNERFIPQGPSYPAGQASYVLYEMPHGVLSSPLSSHTASGQTLTFMSSRGQLPLRVKVSEAQAQQSEEQDSLLAKTVMAWCQAFDDWIDLSTREGTALNSWQNVRQFLQILSGDASEPRMALIVQLAEELRLRLEPIVRMARKILLRERALLSVDRIAETDSTCLRWYIRQPGRTMEQKAAMHRQRLLGIARQESFDTLENRVLKDFLIRCAGTAQKYLMTEAGTLLFQKSSRAQAVRQFQNLCSMLLMHENLQGVAVPASRVRPNYVLQNDFRYRIIWHSYQRLLRQEDEQDRSWDWQSRTWADIARLLTGAALSSMEEASEPQPSGLEVVPLLQSSPVILREQHIGCRIQAGSEPGPFIVHIRQEQWAMELVHAEQAAFHDETRDLGRTGAHLYIVLKRIASKKKSVILLWAVHTAASRHEFDWKVLCRSAKRSLDRYEIILGDHRAFFPALSGIVMASSLSARDVRLYKCDRGLCLFEIPADPTCWSLGMGRLIPGLKACIEESIQ